VRGTDLERLFAEHAQALYGFLAYRVRNPALAEDLLGDTFERVVRSHDHFDARKGSERTWIYTIALNCLRDHLRRVDAESRALERAGPEAEFAQEDALTQVGQRDELWHALERLDPLEREILALRYGSDLRLQEIADVTGLPPATVQGRLYRGLRKLRDILDPPPPDPAPSRSVAET
jgi:RNA polymerase sigma factor (sigma-70 family)